MTSTDLSQALQDIPRFGRLPPLAGLLDDLLDGALRARQRRVPMADNPDTSLAALRVPDRAIDQALLAAGLYGRDAALRLEQRICAAAGAARDAAVFLRIALAVQTRDPFLFGLTAQYARPDGAAGAMRALRDAYWFFPIPGGPFSDDSGHIAALFDKGGGSPHLFALALELAGRRDVKALARPIAALLGDPRFAAAPAAHFALACMGMAAQSSADFVDAALASNNPDRIRAAVGIIAADPRLADDGALTRLVADAEPRLADPAWAILACRHPRRLYDYASQRGDLPPALWLRIVAVTGHIDGVIAACAGMAECDGPISPAQTDVLELALGAVPAEARQTPSRREHKSRALRALVLRVCRDAGIALGKDADTCAWDAEEILFDPQQANTLRLRAGAPLANGAQAFGPAFFRVGNALRAWLVIERAVAGGSASALSALDVARRQELAATMTAFAAGFAQ